jgi:phage N-6-adenine-methyltransferase
VNKTVLFSTGKDTWETPDDLYAELDHQHHFTLDAAADPTNHKCQRWFGPGGERADALSEAWPINQSIWLNPPYSRGAQRKFIERAVECAKAGGRVVSLLPARPDTKLFHDLVWNKSTQRPRDWVREVRFLQGRLRFVGAPASAPFPSMIVWFEL